MNGFFTFLGEREVFTVAAGLGDRGHLASVGALSFPRVFVPHVPVIANQDSAPVSKRRSAFGAARKAGAYHTPSELINQEVSGPERTTTRYQSGKL